MSIEFGCGCGKQYRVADGMAGRRVQCRACGRQITIPAGDAEAGLPDESLLSAAAEMERQAAIQPEPARVPVPPPLPNQDWLKPAVPTPRQTRYVPQKQRKSPKSGAGFSLKTRAAQVFVLLSVVGAGFKVYNKVVGKPSNSPAGYVGSTPANNASRSRSNASAALQTAIAPASALRPPTAPVQGVLRGAFSVEADSGPQTIWVYLPMAATAQAKSLPCVMVAASGGTAVSGVALGDGDVAEHLPYVRAGFAVIAYDVEGDAERLQDYEPAIRAFMRSDAGLRNAERARVNALALFPEIDPDRVFAAGHSSSATLALLLASRNPAIKGVVAYAPAADPLNGVDADVLREIEAVFPDIRRFTEAHAPANCRPVVPVLLVHSRVDEVLPYESSQRYASANSDRVTLVTLDQGGHYDSMIAEGMPRGVAWLRSRAGLPEQAIAPKPPVQEPAPVAAAPRAAEVKRAAPAPRPDSSAGAQPSRVWQVGEYAEVLDGGVWRKSKILQTRENEYRIHYEGWADTWDEWVKPDRIRPLPEQDQAAAQPAPEPAAAPAPKTGPWKQGDSIEVLDHSVWRESKVLKVRGDEYFIHYEGWNSSWDEWVKPDRTRPLPAPVGGPWKQGDTIEVLDHSVWRESKVLKVRGDEYFIHYEGWNSNWDEWVKPHRTRPLRK